MTDAGTDDPWLSVVGQLAAVRQMAAAPGTRCTPTCWSGRPGGKASARWPGRSPRLLLAAGAPAGSADRARHVRLALAEQHPDLRVVEPEGNTFRKLEAERVVRHATLAPIEGGRKVIGLRLRGPWRTRRPGTC